MLIAEIRRKLMDVEDFEADAADSVEQLRSLLSSTKEDLLTADVFGVLKYLPADLYLKPVLCQIAEGQASGSFARFLNGIDFQAEDFEFRFWPNYPTPKGFPTMATEPDVELAGNSLRILFEAKLYSGFGEFQIPRQLLIGLEQEDGRDFYLVLVTAGLSQPRIRFGGSRLSVTDYLNAVASSPDVKLTDAQRQLLRTGAEKVLWTNWRHIGRVLDSAFDANEGNETVTKTARAATASMLGDLRELLAMRSLAPFRGVGRSMTISSLLPLSRFLPVRLLAFAGFQSMLAKCPDDLPAGWLVRHRPRRSIRLNAPFLAAFRQCSEVEPITWRSPRRGRRRLAVGLPNLPALVGNLSFNSVGLKLAHKDERK